MPFWQVLLVTAACLAPGFSLVYWLAGKARQQRLRRRYNVPDFDCRHCDEAILRDLAWKEVSQALSAKERSAKP